MRKLAIVSPNKCKYSETFIHAHICELPFEKVLFHGGYLPEFVSLIPSHFPTSDLTSNPPSNPPGNNKPTGDTCPSIISNTADIPLAWSPWYRYKPTERERIQTGLRRYLKREKVEVLLAEYGPTALEVLDICHGLSIPVVVHFHGYDAYRDDILEEQGLDYPVLLLLAAAIVVVSEDMRNQLISLGASAEKIHLIPYGVDPVLFQPINPGQNPMDLVGVGRFTEKKAPQLTIQAFGLVADRFPGSRLILAGEGDLKQECELLTQSLGLEERVLFPGRLSQGEVAALLKRARGFVQHSIRPANGDSEGLPLAVLEAMATGLPVVATRHAGIPDAVRDGEEGLLCEERDVKAMAENMARILEDGDLAAALGRGGRSRVESHFTRERYLEDLARLLEEVKSD